jgi:phenylacetate-CoA ligase
VLADAIHAYTRALDDAVAGAVGHAAARVPALANRLAAVGVGRVTAVADLDRLPVLSKDDLIAAQCADPPFGGAVVPGAVLRKVFASPGPLYEPQLPGTDPWRWAEALRALGIGLGDTVRNCFSYHLSPAGAMFEDAALAVGAAVVPAGVGNAELQVQLAAAVGVNGYVGLPSYLKVLIDTARTLNLPFPVRRALVTAEPLPDALRSLLCEHVPTVLQAYGTAEVGLLGYETAPGSGLVVGRGVLVQVCDPGTGQPRYDDGIGQVVVTLLRPTSRSSGSVPATCPPGSSAPTARPAWPAYSAASARRSRCAACSCTHVTPRRHSPANPASRRTASSSTASITATPCAARSSQRPPPIRTCRSGCTT